MVTRDKKRQKCGWQGVSLSPHLKAHRKVDGTIWTLKEYKKNFKNADVGEPTYRPPKEHVEKFRAANPMIHDAKSGAEPRPPKPVVVTENEERELRITERFNELWGMVQRDPAAKQFCREAAEDENLLVELRDRYKLALAPKSETSKDRGSISRDINDTQERLQATMKHLALTVEQRRKSNNLGNDTVAQLVSNYAGTRRKWSPERNALFQERIDSIRNIVAERVRVNLLSEVADSVAKGSDHDDNPEDLDAAILRYGERSGQSSTRPPDSEGMA
jgi:hypothetical protein